MAATHAIIPVAGWGTRRLPVAKAVEKCMLPILNRPIIDYIIQDCVAAGIEHIVVVVGEQSDQFQRYFGRDENLEEYLTTHGKEDYLDIVKPPKGVRFEFVVQPRSAPYGTATPVALARPSIPKGERALVLMGDDILYGDDGQNPIAELIETAPDNESAVLTTEVKKEDVSQYGVLVCDNNGHLDHMVEKPSPGEVSSNMINISKYNFTSELLDEIEKFYHEPPEPGKEKFINTEPFNRYTANGGKIKVVRAPGTYLDTGTTEKWLYANMFIARQHGIMDA